MTELAVSVNTSERDADGLASVALEGFTESVALELGFSDLVRYCGTPSTERLELLMLAAAVYAADKLLPRADSPDGWTRSIGITMPVQDVAIWSGAAVGLEPTISFLTGDTWAFSFEQTSEPLYARPRRRRHYRIKPSRRFLNALEGACLFSGGLDSLMGSIDWLESSAGNIILMGHHDDVGGPKSQQKQLFSVLKHSYPGRVELCQPGVFHRPSLAFEHSLRSRSFLFLSLGVCAAATAAQDAPLFAPENGLIAHNLPLTPSRRGSCSTRTMHPFFLDGLREVLATLGIRNPVINPYEYKTKGSCVTESKNTALLNQLARFTVSCAHATRRKDWIRKGSSNCGYCVPCIFRRGALHAGGLDDGSQYGFDICAGELAADDPEERANDLRALCAFLHIGLAERRIQSLLLSSGPVRSLTDSTALVIEGFGEVLALIRDKGETSLRTAAGLS